MNLAVATGQMTTPEPEHHLGALLPHYLTAASPGDG